MEFRPEFVLRMPKQMHATERVHVMRADRRFLAMIVLDKFALNYENSLLPKKNKDIFGILAQGLQRVKMFVQSGDFAICQRRKTKQVRFYVRVYHNAEGKNTREWQKVQRPYPEHVVFLPLRWKPEIRIARTEPIAGQKWGKLHVVQNSDFAQYLMCVTANVLLANLMQIVVMYIN
jgi:hypothetical protein